MRFRIFVSMGVTIAMVVFALASASAGFSAPDVIGERQLMFAIAILLAAIVVAILKVAIAIMNLATVMEHTNQDK